MLSLTCEIYGQNKLKNKTETEAWTRGADWQLPEEEGETG